MAVCIVSAFAAFLTLLLFLPVALTINVQTVSKNINISGNIKYAGITLVKALLEAAWQDSFIPVVSFEFKNKRKIILNKQILGNIIGSRRDNKKKEKIYIPAKAIFNFAKKIRIKKLRFDFCIGVKDRADLTAILSGFTAALINYCVIRLSAGLGAVKKNDVRVSVSPWFDKNGCNLEALCILSVKPVHIIMVIINRRKKNATTSN